MKFVWCIYRCHRALWVRCWHRAIPTSTKTDCKGICPVLEHQKWSWKMIATWRTEFETCSTNACPSIPCATCNQRVFEVIIEKLGWAMWEISQHNGSTKRNVEFLDHLTLSRLNTKFLKTGWSLYMLADVPIFMSWSALSAMVVPPWMWLHERIIWQGSSEIAHHMGQWQRRSENELWLPPMGRRSFCAIVAD